MMRVGIGYDVHVLTSDRPLIIGGVIIPYKKGLLGHSDADVLIHAVMDAMLGAAALGDIGQHFPDRDPRYKGISSLILLKEVATLLLKKGFACHNLDCTVVAQEPKLAPYVDSIKRNLADVLALGTDHINVKATTTEGLGFAGRKEGIAAYAVCTIQAVVS